jgi:hypothetical protein
LDDIFVVDTLTIHYLLSFNYLTGKIIMILFQNTRSIIFFEKNPGN